MSGRVTIVGNTVVKKFTSPRLFNNELATYRLFDTVGIGGAFTPCLLRYSVGLHTVTASKIEGQELALLWTNLSEQQTASYHDAIALVLAQIYRKVAVSEHNAIPALAWHNFCQDAIRLSMERAESLGDKLVLNDIVKVVELVRSQLLNLDEHHDFTWLHRDLVQTNILVTNTEEHAVKFIDFEHSLVGPIEFEFANELLWSDIVAPQDNKFIYTRRIKNLLSQKYGIPYDFKLELALAVLHGLDLFGRGPEVNNYDPRRCVRVMIEKFEMFRRLDRS